MHLKYFLAVISLVFLIQCTNAPSDLSNYEKFHYFDEIALQGVGIPTERQIKEKEFVFVKSDNDLISVYYPYDDILHSYYLKDSLWIRENEYEIENFNEKCFERWYSRRDTVLIYSNMCYQDKHLVHHNYGIRHNYLNFGFQGKYNIIINKSRFDSIVSNELILQREKIKNSNLEISGSRKYNLNNYVLYYPFNKFMKNGRLSNVVNRSRAHEVDLDTFLTKYPEFRYKTNLRDF